MDLSKLIGQIFHDDHIYEILHFDIESNFKVYAGKFIHLYFTHLDNGYIRIDALAQFQDQDLLYAAKKKILGQMAWLEIYEHGHHIDLTIVRKDRSGKISIIGPRINLTQKFREESYDLPVRSEPMTAEEIRRGFAELAGFIENHEELSKPKKAM